MPNNDYISNILEIKDLFITNIDYTSKENHIYFMLKRKDCVCPHCKAITNKVHDYRTSIIKDSPIMGEMKESELAKFTLDVNTKDVINQN
jgi:transposase